MGSSPLTRGARTRRRFNRHRRRLIPAHAGSTRQAHEKPLLFWAHPRSRGEHPTSRKFPKTSSGSSPLTRGARGAQVEGHTGAGLIPAHAGSTFEPFEIRWVITAHPRSRGEHLVRNSRYNATRGSSPLTRGALRSWVLPHLAHGLIPAHAGSTVRDRYAHPTMRAHPRSRGEHLDPVELATKADGSSPLTRGALTTMRAITTSLRLIPAHAGSTQRRRWWS